MNPKKRDRRVQRTRTLLRDALTQLIQEKGYNAVTIEEITERANLGRATFYLHYQSKDDLLLDHHMTFSSELNLDSMSREQLMAEDAQPEMVALLQQIRRGREMYLAFTQAKDADVLMRNIRRQMISNLTENLQTAFPDEVSTPPVDILTTYLVGAQLSLIDWWINNRTPYDANQIAAMLQRLQMVTLRDAFAQ